jgi:hypothetical protein
MRSQKGLDGETPLNIAPTYLLVPAAKKFLARQTLGTIYPQTTADVNPLQGSLEPLVEARLSGTRWYVFADPATLPVLEFAYLTGQEGPQIDTRVGWNVLGTETRCVLHCGVGVVDYRGAYTNAGHSRCRRRRISSRGVTGLFKPGRTACAPFATATVPS